MQKITPNLYIGKTDEVNEKPSDIDEVINLTWEDVPEATETIHLMNGDMNTQSEIRKAIKIVASNLENNVTTLVVSENGSSRAVIISATALAEKHRTDVDTAIQMIKQDYSNVDPHPSLKEHAQTYISKKQ